VWGEVGGEGEDVVAEGDEGWVDDGDVLENLHYGAELEGGEDGS